MAIFWSGRTLITPEQLAEGLEEQRKNGERLFKAYYATPKGRYLVTRWCGRGRRVTAAPMPIEAEPRRSE